MPLLPGKPCKHSGCPSIVRTGYCDLHKPLHRQYEKAVKNSYEQRRKERKLTPKNFYQSPEWIRFRNWYRKQHPLCEDCLEKDLTTPMKIVDHIIEIENGGELTSEDNARSLCQECHNRKTFAKENKE